MNMDVNTLRIRGHASLRGLPGHRGLGLVQAQRKRASRSGARLPFWTTRLTRTRNQHMSDFTTISGRCTWPASPGQHPGCLVLLWCQRQAKVPMTADNTTGHVWDGDLREMNNPLPRWWVWLFVITIVFRWSTWRCTRAWAPTPGKLGWTSTGHMQPRWPRATVEPLYAKFTGMKPETWPRIRRPWPSASACS
jgi:hypothetical protein